MLAQLSYMLGYIWLRKVRLCQERTNINVKSDDTWLMDSLRNLSAFKIVKINNPIFPKYNKTYTFSTLQFSFSKIYTALFSLIFVYFHTSFNKTKRILCQERFRESSYILAWQTQAQSEQ